MCRICTNCIIVTELQPITVIVTRITATLHSSPLRRIATAEPRIRGAETSPSVNDDDDDDNNDND